jgi:flagellar biogenesis protein FliO
MRRILTLGLLSLLLTGPLSAAEAFSQAAEGGSGLRETKSDFSYSPNWPEPPDTGGMLLRLGLGTFVTLGLCVASLVLGRRWLQRPAANSTSRKLRIEETVVLGHRATLFLVQVGDNHLIAGTDAGGLKSLIVLPTAFQEVLDQQVEGTDVTPSPSSSTSKSTSAAAVVWNGGVARAA